MKFNKVRAVLLYNVNCAEKREAWNAVGGCGCVRRAYHAVGERLRSSDDVAGAFTAAASPIDYSTTEVMSFDRWER